jgi:hypothetical protein
MLRDVLAQLPRFGTWPCDEINYIWRHGNVLYPSDAFGVEQARESVKRFIRQSFASIARQQKINYVIEKTCANSLRVSFIEKVFPEAKFVFIVRDGRDVAASSMKRWMAPLDIPYLLKKARYIPLSDAPYYVVRYLANQIHRLFSREKRLAFWGPRFDGMDEMLRSRSLAEVCAMQWVRCVESAENDLSQVDPVRVHRLRYEEFVSDPAGGLKALAKFLDPQLSGYDFGEFIQGVSSKSVGNWKKHLKQDIIEVLDPLISAPMKRYGYR